MRARFPLPDRSALTSLRTNISFRSSTAQTSGGTDAGEGEQRCCVVKSHAPRQVRRRFAECASHGRGVMLLLGGGWRCRFTLGKIDCAHRLDVDWRQLTLVSLAGHGDQIHSCLLVRGLFAEAEEVTHLVRHDVLY